MEWLKIVAKDHKEWVKLVQSFGEDFFAEDIVQESYLRLHKKVLCILFYAIFTYYTLKAKKRMQW